MRVVESAGALRAAIDGPRRAGSSIGLVPTMGSLHDGHASLIERARRDCDLVVMSLFVNPAQFGPGEDLARYPRDRERDERIARAAGVDLVYAPSREHVYPAGFATTVAVSGLGEVLCGDPARRGPGHFSGVTTIVAKLLNVADPDLAYFGQKDAQQAAVIRRMCRDLDYRTRIVVLPTVREPDGLAMSSRNAYLGPGERDRATAINAALESARAQARAGAPTEAALAAARSVLARAGVEPEYLEARDPESLSPVTAFNGRPVLVAVAARVGEARLIDNVVIEPDPASAAREET